MWIRQAPYRDAKLSRGLYQFSLHLWQTLKEKTWTRMSVWTWTKTDRQLSQFQAFNLLITPERLKSRIMNLITTFAKTPYLSLIAEVLPPGREKVLILESRLVWQRSVRRRCAGGQTDCHGWRQSIVEDAFILSISQHFLHCFQYCKLYVHASTTYFVRINALNGASCSH